MDARKALLLELEQSDQVRLDVEKTGMEAEKPAKGTDGGLRATAEKLRLLVPSPRSGEIIKCSSEATKLERDKGGGRKVAGETAGGPGTDRNGWKTEDTGGRMAWKARILERGGVVQG